MSHLVKISGRTPAGSLLLSVLALAACFPAARLLPPAWGWENGVLETLQVMVLLLGAALALAACQRERPSPLAMLALCAVPLWALLAAREMSWGAVLAAPLAFTQHGPLFSSKVLWYKPLVLPLAGLAVGASVLQIWRYRLDRLVRRLAAERRIPWPLLAMAVIAEIGSNCAEGRLHCSFAGQLPYAMVLEELVELVAYAALVLAQAGVLGRHAVSGDALPAPLEAAP